MNGPQLHLDGVTLRYGGLTAVDHVDMALAPGEIVGLVGPNGSGKTSTINAISGVSVISEGKISLRGNDVSTAPPHQLARQGVARTFQLVRLLNGMTVEENVAAGCHAAAGERGLRASLRSLVSPGRLAGGVAERVQDALNRAGIARLSQELVGGLPFGIQRRVEVARAIAPRPEVLLLDEPAAGLSERDLEDLERIVRHQAELGCTVVLVDHHLDFVLRTCPRVVVLNFGKLIFDGSGKDAMDDPQVREAYVGT